VGDAVRRLTEAGTRVSLFVAPDPAQLRAAAEAKAPAVELHTGDYANASDKSVRGRLERLADAASEAARLGLEVHGGHGLTVGNVGPIAALPEIVELNIGHSIVARAVLIGMAGAVAEMKAAIGVPRPAKG
jgi:pyridoxine 5-phosphate synthase